MSDYSSTFTESTGDTIDASDFSTEFDAIEAAIATKLDTDADTATNLTIGTGYKGGAAVSGTKWDSSSGTSHTFGSIPSYVKRVTIMLSNVSTDGAGNLYLKIGGGGGIDSNATYSYCRFFQDNGASCAGTAGTTQTQWVVAAMTSAGCSLTGHIILSNLDSNRWIINSDLGDIGQTEFFHASGLKEIGSVLTQLQLSLSASNFDGGQVNIMYEG